MTNENQNQNNDTVEQNTNTGVPDTSAAASPASAPELITPSGPITDNCTTTATPVLSDSSPQPATPTSDSSDSSDRTPINPSIQESTNPALATPTNPPIQPSINPSMASFTLNHHKGRTPKVAKLPPELIAFVNEQLLRNVPQLVITQELAAKGYPGFSKCNISNWKLGPFRKWLEEQQTIDQQLRQREQALDYARNHGCSLVEVLAQVNAQNLYETAVVMDPSRFVAKLQASPELFLRLSREISAFVKSNRELNRHSPSVAKNRESQPLANPSLREDPTGGLTQEQRDAIDHKLGIP